MDIIKQTIRKQTIRSEPRADDIENAGGEGGMNSEGKTNSCLTRQHFRMAGPIEGRRIGAIKTPVQIYDLSPGGCFINSMHEQQLGECGAFLKSIFRTKDRSR